MKAEGYGVKADSKAVDIIILVGGLAALAGVGYLLWKAKENVEGVINAPAKIAEAISDAYTGKTEMEARTANQTELWNSNDSAYGKAITQISSPTGLHLSDAQIAQQIRENPPEFYFTPEWTGETVVVTAPISSEEYAANKAEAQTWMAPSADDKGITAPYGSAEYNAWALAHPLEAYSEISLWDRTPQETVALASARIDLWLGSLW